MALTIQYEPQELATVGNPIAYRVKTDNALVNFIVMRLFVESEFGALDFEEVITRESPPDDDLESTFYLQELLESRLIPTFPDFDIATMQKQPLICKRYRVAFAELTSATRVEDAVFTEQPVKFAILAKIPYTIFPINKELTDNNLLTLKPLQRRLSATQYEFITFIAPSNAYLVEGIVYAYYTDNSYNGQTFTFGELQKNEVALIPIGVPQRNYPNPDQVTRITVGLGAALIEYTLYEPSDLYERTEFYYFTEQGSFESLVCDGDSEEEVNSEKLRAEHYLPYDYAPNSPNIRDFKIKKTATGTVSTGYLPDEEASAAEQIFYSPYVLMRKKDNFFPVIITKKNASTGKQSERLKSFQIEYQYAYY